MPIRFPMFAAVLVLVAAPAVAQAQTGDATLRRVAAAIGKLDRLSCTQRVDALYKFDGEELRIEAALRIAAERPNRFAIVRDEGDVGATAVCDGKTLYTLLPEDGVYTKEPAPATFDEAVEAMATADMVLGFEFQSPFNAFLFASDPAQWIEASGATVAKVEHERDAELIRIDFQSEGLRWSMWFDARDFLPRRALIDYSEAVRMQFGDDEAVATMTVTFGDWKPDAALPADAFTFTPPADAEEIGSFDEFWTEEAPLESTPHPLVGRPAPDFILDRLTGGAVTLSDHRDKHIVVLDFWATWCGPCRAALPTLIAVTNEYRDRGVRFFAINEGETAETAKAFLDQTGLKMPVLMDPTTRAGTLYGADAIPQTVIVGRDGRVQVVHVGFAPDLEATLRYELDALLAGEELARPEGIVLSETPVGWDPPVDWSDTSDFTMRDWRRRSHAETRAATVETYLRAGHRDPKWDDAAVDLLEKCARLRTSLPEETTFLELGEAGKAVVALGCNDPAVQYATAYGWDRKSGSSYADEHFAAAIDGFADSPYSRSELASYASRYARYLDRFRRKEDALRYHRIAADAIVEVAKTTEDEWFAQRKLTNTLDLFVRDYLPADLAADVVRRLGALDNLNACTLETTRGIHQSRVAWDLRGSGYAGSVTEEGWEGFRKHQEKAREHLERAHELDPSRPESATAMIAVAMAGYARPGENERTWFERAVKGQIDWPVAHQKLLWALRPRWNGSHEAMYRFGEECRRSGRYDTLVPFQLVQAVIDIATDADGVTDFWLLRDVYTGVKDVLHRTIEHADHEKPAREYRSMLAAIAVLTGNHDDAAIEIAKLGGELDAASVMKVGVTPRFVIEETRLYTSPQADRVRTATAALRWDRPDSAVADLEAAVAETTDDELKKILRDRLITAAMQRDLAGGDWVPLTFEPNLPGWRIRKGVWHTSAPDSIRGGPLPEGLQLSCKAPVGSRFEMRGHLDFDDLAPGKYANASVLFRMREHGNQLAFVSFRIYNYSREVRVGYYYSRRHVDRVPLNPPGNKHRIKECTFLLQVWDDFAALSVDDTLVFSGFVQSPDGFGPGPYIAIGGNYARRYGSVRYTDLAVRRIAEPPASILEAMEEAYGQ